MTEFFDSTLVWLIRLLMFSGLFFAGKFIDDLLHDHDLNDEVTHKGNSAMGLAWAGHFSGLFLCLCGAFGGPDREINDQLLDFFLYGVSGVILYQFSRFLGDRIILSRFTIEEDLLLNRKSETGIVVFGLRITSGLILFGVLWEKSGTLWTAGILWICAFGMLMAGALGYRFLVPYQVNEEVRQGNTAAALEFSGSIAAMGIILEETARRKGGGWSDMPGFFLISIVGLLVFFMVRRLLNRMLMPGVDPADEISTTEKPAMGAAFIEVFSSVSAAVAVVVCGVDLI